MKVSKHFGTVLLCLLLLGGVFLGAVIFDLAPGPPTAAELAAEDAAFEKARKFKPFKPFPTATSVRLHMNEDEIEITDGVIPKGSFPSGGAKLTKKEIGVVQGAFKWATPRNYAAACCIPHHAFAFYDITNKYLGSIAVCYECSCTYDDGLTPPRGMETLEWDEDALAKVIQAHGLKTKV